MEVRARVVSVIQILKNEQELAWWSRRAREPQEVKKARNEVGLGDHNLDRTLDRNQRTHVGGSKVNLDSG